ncbi:hypothetical protein ACEQ8H_003118 [Pleosporales sp. CAS-2024a]
MRLPVRDTAAPPPYVVPLSHAFHGNDGRWSTFTISVGTPGQDLCVLPSTRSGVTQVVLPDGCEPGVDPSNCPQLRGASIFGSLQSPGFQPNATSSWSAIGEYDVDLEHALNMTARALFGFDTVTLGPAADTTSMAMDHQVVAGVAELDYFMGLLPLGQNEQTFSSLGQSINSFLEQLRNTTRIPSFSYAYTAGAIYQLKSVFGSLVLGGYDSTRFKANDHDFSFAFSADPSKLLTVGVDSILASNTLQGTVSLSSSGHYSVIDSTVAQLWLPLDVCTQFEQAFGLTYDPQQNLYLVNDTIHQQLVAKNPTLTFKLVNSLQDTTTNYTNIQLPYAAFDLQASYPYYPNATNYFPIRRAANSTQYVLGRTLLQQAYLIVDYERANFTVAQAVFPDPLPAANIVTIKSKLDEASDASSGSAIGTGAIVGIVIAAMALLLAATFAFFFFYLRRKKRARKQPYELASNQVSNAGSAPLHNRTPPMKASGPTELSGTPLTELDSPHATHYPRDQKVPISINEEPVELHGESRGPITPRWEEVQMPLALPRSPYDADYGSIDSRSISQVPSDDGYATGPRSGVSPLTEHFRKQ